MSVPVHKGERDVPVPDLPADFARRLETSLDSADEERRRHQTVRRLSASLPVALLIGPLVAWRLMAVSPDGVRVVIDALAWLAFLLDVGVHIDTAILQYTNMQAIPTIVGAALLVLLAIRLLWYPRDLE
ncbi:MAG TPA: hypothetical protein VF221_07215 [Chloroflexota bacterium]